ncbi:hypothetical protein [Mesorhizobium sp. 131-2-1]|uniref:hypothetical protein n=1 Tax=Mesorhizobium sp. 131-2-1 TaxID=2744518 RepID=UPI001FD2095C|nr:hypothetical protein [Mesorhizobium sp. 131-2-1]
MRDSRLALFAGQVFPARAGALRIELDGSPAVADGEVEIANQGLGDRSVVIGIGVVGIEVDDKAERVYRALGVDLHLLQPRFEVRGDGGGIILLGV